jgi:hypothetical protein
MAGTNLNVACVDRELLQLAKRGALQLRPLWLKPSESQREHVGHPIERGQVERFSFARMPNCRAYSRDNFPGAERPT